MLLSPARGRHSPFIRSGFQWDGFSAYLFDIDGTLLNSRDAVHYHAFHHAVAAVCGIEARIDGLSVHGNTDPGILRAALQRAGLADATIAAALPQIIEHMWEEVKRNHDQLSPELCPAISDLLARLMLKGKLLGSVSGNIEPIGWAKLEKAGLKDMFSFGAFSWPLETRVEIFRRGVELARQRIGENTSVCVVGDTPSDIKAAQDLRLPVMALATGIFSFDELLSCSPHVCLECASDLFFP